MCILALFIRHAHHTSYTPHYILARVLSGFTTFFPRYITNDTIKKKVIEHEMRVLIFSITLSETFLIVRRIQRDIMYTDLNN